MNTATAAATAQTSTVRPQFYSYQSDMGDNKITVEVDGCAARSEKGAANPGPNPMAMHKWEQAGLGVAPYVLIGSGTMTYQACRDAPIQPGTSCDYCGQGISNVYFIRSKCRSYFKVGCDCVRGVCSAKEGVLTQVEQAVRKHNKVIRDRLDARKRDELTDLIETHRATFSTVPHPKLEKCDARDCGAQNCECHMSFFIGKTYADFLDFMFKSCGASGKARLLKVVKAKIATLAA